MQYFETLLGPAWPLVWTVVKIVAIVAPLLLCVAYLTLAERKVIGWMQVRKGPNRVAIFGLQFAKLAGAKAIVVSSSDTKLERAQDLGADCGVNYKTHPDWEKEIMRLTGGRGVDLVIEVGGPGTFERSIKSTRVGGTSASSPPLGALGLTHSNCLKSAGYLMSPNCA